MYGGLGNDCGGAPWTPAKTWFQTPLTSRDAAVPDEVLLLRAVDDEAAVNCESAMKPPLAYDGPRAVVHQRQVAR